MLIALFIAEPQVRSIANHVRRDRQSKLEVKAKGHMLLVQFIHFGDTLSYILIHPW